MYSASNDFKNAIKDSLRTLHWSGTINTPTPINFKDKNVLSGDLTRSISDLSLEIGSVCSSQLTMELNLSVSRYELYGVTITLNVSVDGALDIIPMGTYTIAEALQSLGGVSITAYDNMVKFDDVDFLPSNYTGVMAPYKWLTTMCAACGVTLGSTKADIQSLPNGRRKTGFADSVTDATNWRDVLRYLTAYLGSYAYIGRDGKLYLATYSSVSADTVPANLRYSSDLSDFRTTYDGLYAVDKSTGMQEYVANTNSGGIVLDLGINPFLQFTNSTNRLNALQAIIDAWNGIYYVPFQSDMPLIPTYDPGDVLTFTQNQAGVYDYGAITEITYHILGGTMTVTCTGDDPRLQEAKDRFTKSVEGLSSNYNNGQEIGGKDFWILHVTNTEQITVSGSEIELTEIEWEQKTYGQHLEMILTLDATLSATATVNIRVVVDDDTDLQMSVTEDKSLIGERVFHCSNPQIVMGTGLHVAKVYMTVTDSPLLWSDLV